MRLALTKFSSPAKNICDPGSPFISTCSDPWGDKEKNVREHMTSEAIVDLRVLIECLPCSVAWRLGEMPSKQESQEEQV